MKVLITGGAGFIGVHLAGTLVDRGFQVDLLDNMSRGIADARLQDLAATPGVRMLQSNLLDGATVEALDTDYGLIFHLAAIIGVRHVLERPYQVLTDNVDLTAAALRLARRQKSLQRFLFASTSEVTAGSVAVGAAVPTPETVDLTLTDPAQPRTSYMLSKIYGEAMCHHAGVPFTIFRPHNVFGPRMGMVHVVPELLKRALDAPDGGSLSVASVDHSRAFCYVDDAVRMLIEMAVSDGAQNTVLNLGNAETEITIGDLARIVLRITGRCDLSIEAKPATPGSPARRCPDMSRSITVTGFEPQIGVEEGVRRTFDWYRENIFSGGGETAL